MWHGNTPDELKSNYKRWTREAYTCYKHHCICEGCDNEKLCKNTTAWVEIPYGMKPLKWATINLYKKFGTVGLERFENNVDDNGTDEFVP